MTKALYRKYRSTSLDEIVGQKHVTDILSKSLASGRVAHAYLLTGPRGVGKTSIARILAHEINGLPYQNETTNLDIIEIDAASNNGVEDVRDLREKIHIAPVAARKKIYIIDEVHMLSKAAFNALLKTLEEPPEHAVFILATTDADKLPETIVSRTQRFSFRTIARGDAIAHLKVIAKKENIKIDDSALELIAERGDGSFRDSISLLDQLRSLTDDKTGITRQLIETTLGLAPRDFVEQLLNAYENKNLSEVVQLLDEGNARGIQAEILASQLMAAIRVNVVDRPKLLELLDQLLTVSASSAPDIKLLTSLAMHCAPVTKSAALIATPPAVSKPLQELSRQATQEKPSMPKQKQTKVLATTPGVLLDWHKLIEYTKANYVAVYSVLIKCHHEQHGDKITIYTSNKFYKTKLDDAKHRVNLVTAIAETCSGDFTIETIGTTPPPKDSVAASVAAIMGGGEEVDVSE